MTYRWTDFLVRYGPNGHRERESMLKTLAKTFNTNLLWHSPKKLIQGHYLNHRVKLVTDWVTGERNTFWTSNVEQRTCQTGHYTGHPEAFPIFMEHVPSNMKTELSTLINFISMMNMANTHSTVHIRSTVALIWCINNDILSLWLFCTLFKYFTINFVINIL